MLGNCKISCIIPTLGRGKVLCDTIGMLLDQDYDAHEIIVVDQTPTPDPETQRVLTMWNRQGRIKWLRQAKPNASKARNVGALTATGDVVLFLDDDIVIKVNFLAAYAETFQRTKAVGVAGQVLEGDAKTVDTLPSKAFDPKIGWLYFRKNYSKECPSTSFLMAGNVAVKRDIFLKVGGMDENYEKGAHREETDFAMRFVRAGYTLYFSPQCSLYHLGPGNVKSGGARSWWKPHGFWYFHHCLGDWYFNLGFLNWRNFLPLMVASFRHFVINRQSFNHPWRLPMAACYWLAAMPLAALKRLNGPKLIHSHEQ